MNVFEFVLVRPCLEEISGYTERRKEDGNTLSDAEVAALNEYREKIMRGIIVPYEETRMKRAYVYRYGHAPYLEGRKKSK